MFKVDQYVMSAETVEAACIGLLNLTSEEMMAEAVTELVGSLAGQPGTKTMIDGQIYDGGWSGLLPCQQGGKVGLRLGDIFPGLFALGVRQLALVQRPGPENLRYLLQIPVQSS